MNTNRLRGIILIGLLLTGSLAGIGYAVSGTTSPAAPAPPAATVSGTQMVPANFSELAERARSGVVNIQVTKKVTSAAFGNPPGNPFGDFFGPFGGNPPGRKQQGIGSGFIMNREGYILTNNHVVEGADRIKVKLAEGKELDGKVVGRDPKTDLALVKVEPGVNLRPLALGNSDNLKVGNWVVAVGSPFGLEQTVTAGIVSAKGRVIGSGPYDDFIQTDASINPGNSGGPLINMQGEVVGINTAIIASGQGIGFAIPINMAKEIALQLQEKGHVTRGLIGVNIQDVTPELAKSFGLKESSGALVAQVTPGGPADKAGIEQGDVIVEFDGKPVADSKELPRIVAATPVGKTVTMKVSRDGKEVLCRTTVGELEEQDTAKPTAAPARAPLGLAVQDLTPQFAREHGMKGSGGVIVTAVEPGSAAAEASLRRGDVIREVNRQPVANAADFKRKIEQATAGQSILLLIQRGQNSLFAAVTAR
ncbi:MAG: DegQ family serine endoprotease [Syntrophales bacterium]